MKTRQITFFKDGRNFETADGPRVWLCGKEAIKYLNLPIDTQSFTVELRDEPFENCIKIQPSEDEYETSLYINGEKLEIDCSAADYLDDFSPDWEQLYIKVVRHNHDKDC